MLVTDHYGGTWTIRRNGESEVLADLVVSGGDFPWLNARLDPRVGFADVRPLFVEELRLVERADEDVDSWERAYDAVTNAVTLHYPDGRKVPEFLLHVENDEAWWRWSDEPFDAAEA